MDQERLVCEGRGLSKVKYAVQNSQENFLARDGVFISHTPKTSHWKDSAHLAVRPQCKSWLDRQRGNDYFQFKFSTVGGGGGLTGPGGGQTAGYTGTGGLTGHPWRSDREHIFRPPKIYFFRQDFSRISTDSNLEITQKSLPTKEKNGGAHSEFFGQHSHKNNELEQSGNYRLIKQRFINSS
jgi:hypothetical protein